MSSKILKAYNCNKNTEKMGKSKDINHETKKMYTFGGKGKSNFCIAKVWEMNKNTAKMWSNESNRLDEISQTENFQTKRKCVVDCKQLYKKLVSVKRNSLEWHKSSLQRNRVLHED